jgi:hypothetical protein
MIDAASQAAVLDGGELGDERLDDSIAGFWAARGRKR